ncbi:MAG: TfoX/Sxy family protein [Geminicoccaceae bacterium]
MAYDEDLANRFRNALDDLPGVVEKRMMGGLCFMVNGNMLGGADRAKDGMGRFMFRVGKDNADEAEARPGAMPIKMGGRRMRGFFFVDAATCDEEMLRDWIAVALGFVSSLPPK